MTQEEAQAIVLAKYPRAIMRPEKSRASTRTEYTVYDQNTGVSIGATSITDAETAWLYAAMNVQAGA